MKHIPGILGAMDSLWDSDPSYVVLDLTDVSFIWPSVITLLTTCVIRLRRDGFPVKITRPSSENVDTYLNRVDFYNLLRMNVEYPWRRHNAEGRFREVVQVTSENEAEQVVSEVMTILGRNVEGIAGVYDAVQHTFLEIVNNVFHHANSRTGAVMCAQSYHNQKCVELAVVDSGQGIPASLKRNPELINRFHNAAEAIEIAIQPRTTGRPDYNSGEGLFFSLEFIKVNEGQACIYSQDGVLWAEGRRVWSDSSPVWPGTLVSMQFRTDRPVDTAAIFNQYAPPENDFDWLF